MDTIERPVVSEAEMIAMLRALTALKHGEGSVRLPQEWTGLPGKVAEAFNDVVEMNEKMAKELDRVIGAVTEERIAAVE